MLFRSETTYEELATGFPSDQRPLIGLALLRHSRGDGPGAMAALDLARKRSGDPEKGDPRLDALAASWGLEKLRAAAGVQKVGPQAGGRQPVSPATGPAAPAPTAPPAP